MGPAMKCLILPKWIIVLSVEISDPNFIPPLTENAKLRRNALFTFLGIREAVGRRSVDILTRKLNEVGGCQGTGLLPTVQQVEHLQSLVAPEQQAILDIIRALGMRQVVPHCIFVDFVLNAFELTQEEKKIMLTLYCSVLSFD